MPPVGKSGAGTMAKSCSSVSSEFSCKAIKALTTSVILCGGIEVAIPTAIPAVPLINKLGNLLGKTVGSMVDSSKFGTKVTVSFSISAKIS